MKLPQLLTLVLIAASAGCVGTMQPPPDFVTVPAADKGDYDMRAISLMAWSWASAASPTATAAR